LSKGSGSYIPIDELDKVERAELEAEQSLQISESGDFVVCQLCHENLAIPIAAIRAGVYSNRAHYAKIYRLKNQIDRIKSYPHCNGNADIERRNDISRINKQIAELEEEETKRLKYRCLPVHKIRVGKYKFLMVCGNCFDQLYPRRYRELVINEF
jgi:hypothetical protein